MKSTFTLVALFIIGATNAQVSDGVNKAAAAETSGLTKVASYQGAGTSSMTFFNPPRQVDGSEYLFDDWNNYAIIHTEDNQHFALKNINLNIKQNSFVSKVEGDSLFTFNFNNIDRVEIEGKDYKNYYWNDDNRVYEIIYEGKDWSIIKGFSIVEVTGSANPMLARTRDRLVRKSFYYIKDDKGIHHFRLTKNKILKALKVSDAEKSKIVDYAKRNNYSFKREDELRKILEFSSK
jgi:hypothetical protein